MGIICALRLNFVKRLFEEQGKGKAKEMWMFWLRSVLLCQFKEKWTIIAQYLTVSREEFEICRLKRRGTWKSFISCLAFYTSRSTEQRNIAVR